MFSWGIFSQLIVSGNFGQVYCLVLTSFYLRGLCDVQDRIDKGCFEKIKSPRDPLECFAICGWDNACFGVLIPSTTRGCYREKACTFSQSCSSPDSKFRYYSKTGTNALSTASSTIPTTTVSETTTTDQSTTSTTGKTTTASTTTDQPTITSTTAETTATTITTTTTTITTETTTTPPFCQNSGTQVSSTKCDCSETDGWVGDRCERRPYNCMELSNFGYSSGTRMFAIDLYRNNSRFVSTVCNVGASGSEISLLKHTGQFNFRRTWDDYVKGFFYNADNYFLGLDSIHAYNKKGFSKIGVHLNFSSSTVNGKVNQEYYSFSISGNTSGYAYTVGSSASTSRSFGGSGNTKLYDLGDPFNPCQNTPFSTFDNDQDKEPTKNCADLTATGWWFKTCTPEPPVSPLGSVNATSSEQRVILPKYDTMSQGPREAFKYIYMYLLP